MSAKEPTNCCTKDEISPERIAELRAATTRQRKPKFWALCRHAELVALLDLAEEALRLREVLRAADAAPGSV